MKAKANGWWVVGGVCCLIVPIHASSAQRSDSSPQTPSDVTVVGCLLRLDDSARTPGTSSGGGSSSSRTPPSSGFALKDAAIMSAPERPAGPVATKSEREFRVLETDVKLEKLAGQQVEVKAQLSESAGDGHALRVKAARVVSAKCPPQGGR